MSDAGSARTIGNSKEHRFNHADRERGRLCVVNGWSLVAFRAVRNLNSFNIHLSFQNFVFIFIYKCDVCVCSWIIRYW
jgi:hypothetical protein